MKVATQRVPARHGSSMEDLVIVRGETSRVISRCFLIEKSSSPPLLLLLVFVPDFGNERVSKPNITVCESEEMRGKLFLGTTGITATTPSAVFFFFHRSSRLRASNPHIFVCRASQT